MRAVRIKSLGWCGTAATLVSAAVAQAEPPTVAPDTGREAELSCLASAVAYEAGFEPLEGKQAVAEIVLNRMHAPGFPKTICGVVFAGSTRRTGCQFSFTCDGSLRKVLPAATLAASRAVAEAALDGHNPVRVGGATHYHADYVTPYWAASLTQVAKIGAHIFYRRGLSGTPPQMATAQPRPAAPVRGNASPAVFAPWGLSASPPGA